MTLRCTRCNKPLQVPAAEAGPYAWGRKCALMAGVIKPRKRGPRITSMRVSKPQEAQMDLLAYALGVTPPLTHERVEDRSA